MSHLRYSQVKRCTTGKECSVGVGTAQFVSPEVLTNSVLQVRSVLLVWEQLSMSHLRYSQVKGVLQVRSVLLVWVQHSMSHLRYSQVKRCTTGKECSVGVGTAQYVSPEVLTSKKVYYR